MQSRRYALASFAAVVLLAAGCGQYLKGANPVAPAIESGNPEVIAFALEGSYTIVQSKAADIAEDPATPAAVKRVILCVAEKANPILDELRPVAVEAETLRAKIAAGGDGADRLAVILRDINADVNRVAPLVNDLVAAVGGKAQGECS